MGEVLGAPIAPGTVASLATQAERALGEFTERARADHGRAGRRVRRDRIHEGRGHAIVAASGPDYFAAGR
ncbi:hypothetical protein ACRJ4B_12045 [Streptomyces sp. GTA36]